MGVLDILGGGDTGSLDVLDGGRETRVGKSGLLGELVVEVGNSGTHVAVEGLAVCSHLGVHLTEPAVGPLASGLNTVLHSLDDLGVTGSRGSVHSSELDDSGLAGSLELSVDGGSVGAHLRGHDAGVLGHLLGMSGDVPVGLLDLLGGLLLKGEEGTLLGGNGITDLVDDVLLVASDLGGESGASGTTLLLLSRNTLVEGSELSLSPGDLLLQVSLGDDRGGLDGIEHLLAHLSAGSGSLQVELVNLGVDVFGKGRDLGGDPIVEGRTGLLVDLLHLLLDLKSTLLTLVDGIADSGLQLGLVELADGTEAGTASGILNVVLHDYTSELLDASVVLAREVTDSLVETSDPGGEGTLGRAEGSLSIHLSTAGGCSKSMVCGLLGSLVLGEDTVQTGSLRSKTTLGVSTVALHLLADGSNLLEEAVGKLLHAAGSLGLVTGHEGAELLVLLEMLLVAGITNLHHALELSRHLTVDLGLFELVVLHDTRELGHTVVELGSLLVHHTRELEDGHLEVTTELSDTSVRLLLRSSDVGNSLREATVLEGLVGIQGGIHTGGGVLERHVSMGTVASHGGTALAELSRGLSSDLFHLVVGILAETLVLCNSLGRELGATLLCLLGDMSHLLVEAVHGLLEVLAGLLGIFFDLSSIGCNVLVSLPDLGIGGRRQSGESTLLSRNGKTELLRSMCLVLAHDLASLAGAGN